MREADGLSMCRGWRVEDEAGAAGRRRGGGARRRFMNAVKEDMQRGGVTEEVDEPPIL